MVKTKENITAKDLDNRTVLHYLAMGIDQDPTALDKLFFLISDFSTPTNTNDQDCDGCTFLHYLIRGIAKQPNILNNVFKIKKD